MTATNESAFRFEAEAVITASLQGDIAKMKAYMSRIPFAILDSLHWYVYHSPLDAALRGGHLELVELLLAAGSDIKKIESFFSLVMLPLHELIPREFGNVMDVMLRAKPNSPLKGYVHRSLYLACSLGETALVRRLLAAGCRINERMSNGLTPFMSAVLKEHVDIMELLLRAGFDPKWVDSRGRSPLLRAAAKGKLNSVELMLRAGFDKDALSPRGLTPLYVAARRGRQPVVARLLAAGCDPDIGDGNQWTPLYAAALFGHVTVVQTLLAGGCNPHATNNKGYTPLHAAATRNNALIVEILLSATMKADEREENKIIKR